MERMKLVEFTAYWCGDYTKEELETYAMLYGDDKSVWPETDSTGPIVLDIEKILRINPSNDEGKTIVELMGSRAFSIVMPYEQMLQALQFYGLEIYSFKNVI